MSTGIIRSTSSTPGTSGPVSELVYQYTRQDPTSVRDKISDGLKVRAYLSSGNEVLNLEFNQDLHGTVAIRIYDLSGKLMQHTELESVWADTPSQVTVNGIPPGYYVLGINSGKLNQSQAIIIK
jgi:hypothetical protein